MPLWKKGTRYCVYRVLWVSHPDPRDLPLVPELPKLKCRLSYPTVWAMYQLTSRINHGDTESKWKFHVIHMYECHVSPSPGLQPKQILGLALVLGLSALGFESVFTWLLCQVPGKCTADDPHSNCPASAGSFLCRA